MQISVNTSAKTESLSFGSVRTYIAAAAFIIGNIALPQLCHLIPQGGVIWLPIYLFTLVGAWRYGWRVGLLTALASPVANALLFGMPAVAALPAIMLKSILLALLAGVAAYRYGRATLLLLVAVVLGYQTLGTLGEWAIKGDLWLACQDFRIGIPGMLLQIAGGWLLINLPLRK